MLWVLRYWRPIAAVASVVAVLAGAWAWRQSVYREGEAAGRAACEARYTAALEAATAAQARKDAEYRAGLADREAALRDALARLSAPPPPQNGGQQRPAPVVTPDGWKIEVEQ